MIMIMELKINVSYSQFRIKNCARGFFCLFSKQKVNELLGREKLKFGKEGKKRRKIETYSIWALRAAENVVCFK